ncbi:MAG: hypothetical protein HYY13_01540 [Nitrospirae bacterium]|nr:hypothetical protein [Nitrospirota bacterium]
MQSRGWIAAAVLSVFMCSCSSAKPKPDPGVRERARDAQEELDKEEKKPREGARATPDFESRISNLEVEENPA